MSVKLAVFFVNLSDCLTVFHNLSEALLHIHVQIYLCEHMCNNNTNETHVVSRFSLHRQKAQIKIAVLHWCIYSSLLWPQGFTVPHEHVS